MHPELKIAVGHGQMGEDRLEHIMTDFVAGNFDVLVCTTIIESGIDIPNCNTLIIEGADRFGLAQLYQIRGRVGRFKRQAYAYLLLRRHAALVEKAAKRLNALRQHNQLGAGLRIAMRDLELRGAGNLLGAQQSGHIAGVGFELYCQPCNKASHDSKTNPKPHTSGQKSASILLPEEKVPFPFATVRKNPPGSNPQQPKPHFPKITSPNPSSESTSTDASPSPKTTMP